MQCALALRNAPPIHVPDVPVHVSATSHWPAEARHVTLAALYASTHEFLLPAQRSAASLSHAPPCEPPVQLVDADAKPSAAHAPALPVPASPAPPAPAHPRHAPP